MRMDKSMCKCRVHCGAVFVLVLSYLAHTESLEELRILNMMPMTGVSVVGVPNVPAVLMAVDDINARHDILPGYNLTVDIIDSKCNPGSATFAMLQKLHTSDRPYAMILGPTCSTATKSCSEVSQKWNRTQVCLAGSSPILDDHEKFPNLFRMAVSDVRYNLARKALCKAFNWTKVSFITQSLDALILTTDTTMKDLVNLGYTIVANEIFMQDSAASVRNLKEKDARIVIAFTYERSLKKVLCEAYKIGFYGPKIVWMILGVFPEQFWKIRTPGYDCTAEQLEMVIEGAFLWSAFGKNTELEKGEANINFDKFYERYLKHPTFKEDFVKYNKLSTAAYDQTWLAALALNCTMNKLVAIGHPKTLADFDYSDYDIHQILYNCFQEGTLVGLTGHIRFNGGTPDTTVDFRRVQDGKEVLIAQYGRDKVNPEFELYEEVLKWKDGKIPRDSTLIEDKETVIPTTLYVVMCILSASGILLAIFFLFINFKYKNNKSVKMSSPNINNILLLGCIVSYLQIMFKPTDMTSNVICKIRLFTFTIGFSLTFGALLSKTWRVYRIFMNKKMQRRTITDIRLMGSIAIYLILMLAILLIWDFVSPYAVVVKYQNTEVYTTGNDVEVHLYVTTCYSELATYFGWAIYGIMGGSLLFGAFLAFETRNIKIAALNDSHEIGLCVYCVVVLSATGLLLSLLLEQQVTMLYGATSGCLFVGTTLTQMVVFIPKCRSVFTDTEKVGTGQSATASAQTGQSATSSSNTRSSM